MNCPKDKFFNKLREIADMLENIHKQVAQKVKMSCGELGIFRLLCHEDKLSATQISKLCKLDKPATSRNLNKLTDCGLVDKTYKDNNKKTQYVSLTTKGEQLKEYITEQLTQLSERYFNKLSQKDTLILLSILDKVVVQGEQNA